MYTCIHVYTYLLYMCTLYMYVNRRRQPDGQRAPGLSCQDPHSSVFLLVFC